MSEGRRRRRGRLDGRALPFGSAPRSNDCSNRIFATPTRLFCIVSFAHGYTQGCRERFQRMQLEPRRVQLDAHVRQLHASSAAPTSQLVTHQQGRVQSSRARQAAANGAAVYSIPNSGVQVAAPLMAGRGGRATDARGRGAVADVCLCDCRCTCFNPLVDSPPYSRLFVSAWADGCLIASMSSVAHFHQHQHELQPSYDVDLERSAADTRRASMLAQSCDGVS